MRCSIMNDFYKHKEWQEMYFQEMNKIMKLDPCMVCIKVIYLMKDNMLEKVCEQKCELFKKFNILNNEFKQLLISQLKK